MQAGDGFVHRADVGAMRLLEGGQRPPLRLQPFSVPFGPGPRGQCDAATMAQEEMREAMPRAEDIGADVLATAEQIAGGLFLLAGDVNRRERAGDRGPRAARPHDGRS